MLTNEEIERMDRIMDNTTISIGYGLESMIGSGTQQTWTTATLTDFYTSPYASTTSSYHWELMGTNTYIYDTNLLSKRIHNNYTIQEVKRGKQTKFILTTKSGIKKEKLVSSRMVEQERQYLKIGRVINYKQYWQNV